MGVLVFIVVAVAGQGLAEQQQHERAKHDQAQTIIPQFLSHRYSLSDLDDRRLGEARGRHSYCEGDAARPDAVASGHLSGPPLPLCAALGRTERTCLP